MMPPSCVGQRECNSGRRSNNGHLEQAATVCTAPFAVDVGEGGGGVVQLYCFGGWGGGSGGLRGVKSGAWDVNAQRLGVRTDGGDAASVKHARALADGFMTITSGGGGAGHSCPESGRESGRGMAQAWAHMYSGLGFEEISETGGCGAQLSYGVFDTETPGGGKRFRV